MEDYSVKLAKLFKERENISFIGIQIGKVISPPPEIKIQLGKEIILTKDKLIFCASVLNGYKRLIEIPQTNTTGKTDSVSIGDHGSHLHNVAELGLTGELIFTDTLKQGDEIILFPTQDEQLFFVLDKAVRL